MQAIQAVRAGSIAQAGVGGDLPSQLREVLGNIQFKGGNPALLLSNVFRDMEKLAASPISQKDSGECLKLLSQIAKECLAKITEPHHFAVLKVREIPLSKAPLMLELEKAFVSQGMAEDSKTLTKLIACALLSRFSADVIERVKELKDAKAKFTEFFRFLVALPGINCEKEFRDALHIYAHIEGHLGNRFLFNLVFDNIISEKVLSEIVINLKGFCEWPDIIPRPVADEITNTLRILDKLPLTKAEPNTLPARLYVSSFFYHAKEFKELANGLVLVCVSRAHQQLSPVFKSKELAAPYLKVVLDWTVFQVNRTDSPVGALSLFAQLTERLPIPMTALQETIKACFTEVFFRRLDMHLAAKVRREEDVEASLSRLEELSDGGFHLLQKLLEIGPKGPFIILSKIFQRYDQILRTDFNSFEKTAPSQLDLFKIAFAIELLLDSKLELNFSDFVYIVQEESAPFGRELVFDVNGEKTVCIGSKQAESTLNARGGTKEFTNLLKLPLDTHGEPVICAVGVVMPRKASDDENQALFDEAGLQHGLAEESQHILSPTKFYSKVKMVWDEKAHAKVAVELAAVEMPKFEHSGVALLTKKVTLSDMQLLELANNFMKGILAIHKAFCIHGDIKPGNYLFNVLAAIVAGSGNISVTGKVSDVGFISSATVGKPLPSEGEAPVVKKDARIYRSGFTGTPYYTSPDHFLVTNFAGDHFKSEVFTLGVALFLMVFPDDDNLISWGVFVDKFFGNLRTDGTIAKSADEIREAKAFFDGEVQKFQELPGLKEVRRKKTAKEKMTVREELLHLIGAMLILKPEERIDLQVAVDISDALLKSVTRPAHRKVHVLPVRLRKGSVAHLCKMALKAGINPPVAPKLKAEEKKNGEKKKNEGKHHRVTTEAELEQLRKALAGTALV